MHLRHARAARSLDQPCADWMPSTVRRLNPVMAVAPRTTTMGDVARPWTRSSMGVPVTYATEAHETTAAMAFFVKEPAETGR
jgi:hypothetical protein